MFATEFCAQKGLVSAAFVVWLVMAVVPMASAEQSSDQRIQTVIIRQIQAFANGESLRAWEQASPDIQRSYGSPETFMTMVEKAYPAIFDARQIEFGERIPHAGIEIQEVRLKGPAGRNWIAYYQMVPIDGKWRIQGVTLRAAPTGI